MTLTLPEKFEQYLFIHATQEYPRECCGILAGNEETRVVERIYKCRNASDNPEVSFFVNSTDQRTAFEDIVDSGLDLLGFYHSHPDGRTSISKIDLAYAFYHSVDVVIVALTNPPSIHVHTPEEIT